MRGDVTRFVTQAFRPDWSRRLVACEWRRTERPPDITGRMPVLRVILLQALHRHRIFLERTNSVQARLRRAYRRHDRDFFRERRIANRHFIFTRNFSARRVDDEIDIAVNDAIENIGPAFAYLENFLHWNSGRLQRGPRSRGRDDSKSELDELSRQRHDRLLVAVFHADENVAAFW